MDSVRIYVVLVCALSSVVTSLHTVPITKRAGAGPQKRQNSGAIGVGDIQDSFYSVEVTIGSVTVPLFLDTGSSDLWAITPDCNFCGSAIGTPRINASLLKSTGMQVVMQYGTFADDIHASGTIVSGPVGIAGIQIKDQFIAAVNDTNDSVVKEKISGFFGTGFPKQSEIFYQLTNNTFLHSPSIDYTDVFLSSLPTQGPMLFRLANSGQLEQPMYTITLERETFQVGGNVGQLTLGKLPDGVSNDSLTWLPVRLYSEAEGGLQAPTGATEIYPIYWEFMIDDVLLNGQILPKPSIAATVGYSAVIDSGTFHLSTTGDVVDAIYSGISGLGTTLDPSFPCSEPVNLAYIIGGQLFPIDPRDFIGQYGGIGESCNAQTMSSIAEPSLGSFYSWVLGDPFLKSNLIAFYFGNLTHPSVDPPRIGILSTVPKNADDLYSAAIAAAQAGKLLDDSSISAPNTTFSAAATDFVGVKQVTTESAVHPSITVTCAATLPGCTLPPIQPNGVFPGIRPPVMSFVSVLILTVWIFG